MPRADAQTFAHRLCQTLAVAYLAICGLYAVGLEFALEREIWLAQSTGYGALTALFLSLTMTPVARLAGWLTPKNPRGATWLALRRSLGIASACLALGHAGLVLCTYLKGAWSSVLEWPYLRAGLTALVILTLLLVTSFPEIVKALRIRQWKSLHRLSYVAALFLLQHLLQSPFADRRITVALFAGLVLVSLPRFLPKPRRQPRSGTDARSTPSPAGE